MRCPHCGKQLFPVPQEVLGFLVPGWTIGGQVLALLLKSDRPLSIKDLASVIYRGAKPPTEIGNTIRPAITDLRKKIEPHGWTITRGRSGPAHAGFYRLVRLDEIKRKHAE